MAASAAAQAGQESVLERVEQMELTYLTLRQDFPEVISNWNRDKAAFEDSIASELTKAQLVLTGAW